MDKLVLLFDNLLTIIFPRDKEVVFIEKMNVSEFKDAVPKADEVPKGIALFSYRHPLVKTAVQQVKYSGNRKITKLLATVLYEELVSVLEERVLFSGGTSPLLLPIPISKKRRRERGYNQCERIVNVLKKIDDGTFFEVRTDILEKVRDTESQTRHNRKERLENLKGCFEIKNPTQIKGRDIILIDDVITTGATLEEAEKTLKKAGARHVYCFALAH